MKQATTLMISLSLYLGSLFLIDSALVGGHKGAEGHDHDRGNNSARMLFRGIDMTDEQRKEVRQIMNSSMRVKNLEKTQKSKAMPLRKTLESN